MPPVIKVAKEQGKQRGSCEVDWAAGRTWIFCIWKNAGFWIKIDVDHPEKNCKGYWWWRHPAEHLQMAMMYKFDAPKYLDRFLSVLNLVNPIQWELNIPQFSMDPRDSLVAECSEPRERQPTGTIVRSGLRDITLAQYSIRRCCIVYKGAPHQASFVLYASLKGLVSEIRIVIRVTTCHALHLMYSLV